MYKLAKYSIIFLGLIAGSYVFGFWTPSIAKVVQSSITPGMSASDVVLALTKYPVNPYLCSWEIDGSDDEYLSKRE